MLVSLSSGCVPRNHRLKSLHENLKLLDLKHTLSTHITLLLTTFPVSSNCCVGGLHHEFETDGKTYNTTSTLVVHTYGRNSTVHCVIRHKGLEGRQLVAPFRFEDLGKKDVFLRSLI